MFDILIVKLNLEKQKKPIAKENVAEIVIYRRNIKLIVLESDLYAVK